MLLTRTYLKSAVAASGVLAAIITMVGLGLWQLQRMQQKELRLNSIAELSGQQGVALSALNLKSDLLQDVPVQFVGQPDLNRLVFLDNRIEGGVVGYEVLVPVVFEHGQVLVNYGWVAATQSRQQLPVVSIDPGEQMYHGVVSVPQRNPLVSETAQSTDPFPLLIQQLDLPKLEVLLETELVPVVIQLSAQKDSAFVRNWQPVVMPPEKHFAYAVQWFVLAMAAAIVALLVFFSKGRQYDSSEYKS
ncbi:SURF1 family protein [Alteromonas aestuariivivens]|uniref:SURF1-like protein n=1 Tax=Alteromonas aestuariivivens TaxID=1938339 RepID=A0A3D8M5E1_9ALTE|nr:SURF1 family protein [Alteromonas aestuariivivens]RDV24841.1 SURF1 family protein [Alteromonas aestuariivivens]